MMNVPRAWSLLLFAPLLGMLQVVNNSDNPNSVEIVEFLDGSEMDYSEKKSPHMINTNGYWNKGEILLVHVSAKPGVDDAAVRSTIDLINGVTESKISEWNELLSSFEGSAPLLSTTQDLGQANIKVVLANDEHPEGKLGKARLYVVKGIGEIISAEVEIFASNRMHESGMLEYSLAHELGHALGLSHSTDPYSIMHEVLNFENGSIQNHVGSCEAEGISALYVKSMIGKTVC